LVNAERYITPELKEHEEKVLQSQEKIVELEYTIFQKLREKVLEHIGEIQKTAQKIATLDVILDFARIALMNNYCKPHVYEGSKIEIKDGRHPVVEKIGLQRFVPNDTLLDKNENRFLLITGPNMAGKSVYLRQMAHITLMAHMGSFVPAKESTIGLIDRIFTRVGASDDLARGQSTFMVEMQETANILNHATEKSLIILDEIGRGTSTYDGVSIAWAVTEYIHEIIKARTVFATHYHELIAVVDRLKGAKNLSAMVKETMEGIIFLYKIQKGGVDRSYGIEVARLAALPAKVTERAQQILEELEENIVE
jgi:DNA mismatch repair protein MutS